MSDPVDPLRLAKGQHPSLVEQDGAKLFVASAEPTDGGWLWVQHWDGDTGYLPRRRVDAVHRLERERYLPDGENQYTRRVADPGRRADALDAAGLQDTGAEGTGEDGSPDPSDDAEVLTDG